MLKDFLMAEGKDCYYFNLENQSYLNVLNKHPYNIFELIPEKSIKQYVFIDEIQYLDDPSNFLKLLYDEKRSQIKIIASGSSSFYIDKKFRDSLAGRKYLFEIFALNFDEFILFKNEENILKQKGQKISAYYQDKIRALWHEYIEYGAYPKVALSENPELRLMNLEEIGSSYIKKDINDAGIRNQEKYFALLKILAEQTGSLVNLQELSGTLGLARKTIDEYLYVIRKSYQTAFIKPFFKNFRKELVKMPKCYFYDLGLRNYFLGNYETLEKRTDKGEVAENLFFKELLRLAGNPDKIKFWRTQDGREVDFVLGKKAWEIKYNSKKTRLKKSETFTTEYPDIELSMVSFDMILEIFYGYKMNRS
ncbi:hypothetical protein A2331_07135 [Candidatus Falkowbacteria bacterium RIFOXYB2_FULL_34_18]|uniref:AAA domain-containing protein n=1 Tax=Candidatus Falkowbacteria bacterium RIFOXYD2_FULL_34_120 TaxID=1798007 RepID=A0A1F5TS22_9BACT|nr:MAG: hypothetical protein A2331_07135 [Candidatus Falkowbacteria bacterium RIFOXYB2_FULL_34_18]OGF30022.1 MAG: hypothetical protein A2500_03540 [Candidatus Falkowbacteria bacterium RIFOXYC12_FULL_34_55]OGF37258.1 MAG: hypothetical protein A2466_02975 [Candidatus Falkowbacteria bacterium RIFOXYC2_FULL_34_220]OGF39558.1 MAG: hypothetical protein A2515_03915 [Candidatus Falkowbacteria bacterium RIFOXYD12_FULL_34_57]OGF41597.1 MAG: hypothetical protein A2531_02690 [Candidatus Falkowbacteria bact